MIEYKIGSIFDAPKGVVLAHACNAQGVWGSGVAKVFKEKFPDAFELYNTYCTTDFTITKPTHLTKSEENFVDLSKKKVTRDSVGNCCLVYDKEYRIACLITSDRYGKYVDEPAQILQATKTSLEQLVRELNDGDEIHMPKINSGLFNTPWEETEKCIEFVLSNSGKNIKCVVWTPDTIS